MENALESGNCFLFVCIRIVKSSRKSVRGKFVLLALILTPIQLDRHLLKEHCGEPQYPRKFSSHNPLDPSGLRPKHGAFTFFELLGVFQIGDLTVCPQSRKTKTSSRKAVWETPFTTQIVHSAVIRTLIYIMFL